MDQVGIKKIPQTERCFHATPDNLSHISISKPIELSRIQISFFLEKWSYALEKHGGLCGLKQEDTWHPLNLNNCRNRFRRL